MVTISFSNQKGGCAKTTSAINISTILARDNKVLLIDFDPQANATKSLVGKWEKSTIYDVLAGNKTIDEAVIKTDFGLHLLASNIHLAGAEVELKNETGGEFVLEESLQDMELYDYIIIDTPPSLGMLTTNALVASDKIIIPVGGVDFHSMDGLVMLKEDTLNLIRTRLRRPVNVLGILLTRMKIWTNMGKGMENLVRERYGDLVFKSFIPDAVGFSEAPSHVIPGVEYAPRSKAAKAYEEVTEEIIRRLKL